MTSLWTKILGTLDICNKKLEMKKTEILYSNAALVGLTLIR